MDAKPATRTLSEEVRILERAEKLLGRKKIADGLKVSEKVVESWCDGSGTLSHSHLLRLADLLAKYADTNR
jgi:predicted transcriptional regulator